MRIGAVNYLNSKPLVYELEERLPDAEISCDLPSRLADQLASGRLDVALVPAIELARQPGWTIVSDACIGCRGPVLSVKLLFRVEPRRVRTLALDEGSRTSVVLAQILLSDFSSVRPELVPLPIGAEPETSTADAVLVIGDRAIRSAAEEFVEVWDLGDRWCRSTELPFVFAMWVARPAVANDSLREALAEARDAGCRHISEIAYQQAAIMDLEVELVQEYLCDYLHFTLGPDERRGLEHFFQRAAELGLIASAPEIQFDDCPVEHP